MHPALRQDAPLAVGRLPTYRCE